MSRIVLMFLSTENIEDIQSIPFIILSSWSIAPGKQNKVCPKLFKF